MDNEKVASADPVGGDKEKKTAQSEPRAKKKASPEKNMTFEAAMERLEAVVRALEDGKTTLEESMKLYEEGVALVRLCSARLEDAERKVKILTGSRD